MSIAIKVEDLSKQYRLGKVGTGTLSHDLNRWWHLIRGKEDPYLKIGDTNDRSTKGESEYVWALKDINFEVEQGEAMGIIGRNGAGKSTLLKILSRTTAPTKGNVKLRGRVASLLEVGTGFHPELSGRENIYLNGAILGMTRREITKKFEEIVDFAGVERYIDTPVKRYSSGMYVRLAFAVAAHLESEILIVDEVLAVGDAEFQKKCLGKMGEVSKGEGRTVLFVSHNLTSLKTICGKGILLSNGFVDAISDTEMVIRKYKQKKSEEKKNPSAIPNEYFTISHYGVVNDKGTSQLSTQDKIHINICFKFKQSLKSIAFEIFVKNEEDILIFSSYTQTMDIMEGERNISCIIPPNILNDSKYQCSIGVSQNYMFFLAKYENLIELEVEDSQRGLGWQGKIEGLVRPCITWSL